MDKKILIIIIACVIIAGIFWYLVRSEQQSAIPAVVPGALIQDGDTNSMMQGSMENMPCHQMGDGQWMGDCPAKGTDTAQ